MRDEFLIDRQGKKAVLYAGLLDQAHQEGLKSIQTRLLQVPDTENGQTAICHATVETSKGVFEGIGDANPGNVGRMVVGHIIRMAETRAKARALRDAINVGVVSLEELEDDDDQSSAASKAPTTRKASTPAPPTRNASPSQQSQSGTKYIIEEQIAEMRRHRERLGWDAPTLVRWVKSRADGRGPRDLTYDEATSCINALGIIPTPEPQSAVAVFTEA